MNTISLLRATFPVAPYRLEHDMSTEIDEDFQAWCMRQAALLREGCFDRLDAANVIEELESLAHDEVRRLREELRRAMYPMIMWRTFPGRLAVGWYVAIQEARGMIDAIQDSSPSTRTRLPELMAQAYERARDQVINDTGLAEALLSKECPFDFEYLMTFNLDNSRMANRI
jgi:hypothetical protein